MSRPDKRQKPVPFSREDVGEATVCWHLESVSQLTADQVRPDSCRVAIETDQEFIILKAVVESRTRVGKSK